MVEEISMESESQFMDNFMAMRVMVEEMYQEFKKGQGKSTSTPKKDKGVEEPPLDAPPEAKGKGEKPPPPSPPSSSSHSPDQKRKKISLIKLDVNFDLPIYVGELNAEKLDN